MKFNLQKFESNEKLVLTIALSVIGGAFLLFGLTVLMIERFEFLEKFLQIFATVGLITSAAMVITGNIRILRFLIVLRKELSTAVIWKSVIVIPVSLLSLVIYWFILLILILQGL